MTTMRLASLAALAAAVVGCTVGEPARPAYPTPSTEPSWSGASGPPGGAIDPGWGYTEGEGSYEGSYPPAEDDPSAYAQPSGDPASANYALGELTDAEMEGVLQPYGEWVEDPIYGWIWIPYTTVVGADFTPYDSGGEWVYTDDYGWSFDSTYDWGWVAFHFGNWMMYDDASWGWVPGNTWAPHHCDWRYGSSGTVGWRPTPPEPRDHRTGPFGGGWRPGSSGPANTVPSRGHNHGGRRDPDATWTFAAQTEFGLRNRPTRFAQSDGIRDTTPVVRPPFGARDPSRARRPAAALMGHRLQTNAWLSTHPTPVVRPDVRSQQRGNWGGAGGYGQSSGGGRPWVKPPSPWNNGYQRPPVSSGNSYQPSRPTWTRPQDRIPQRPSTTYGGRGYTSGPLWTRPVSPSGTYGSSSSGNAYQPPSRSPYTDRGPRYTPPSGSSGSWNNGNTYQPPSRPSGNAYQPPSRPSWTPPADRAPSRGSWSSGSSGSRPSWNTGGYRAPAQTFSPSQSSGGSRPSGSYSGGSRSSGSFSPSSSSGGSRSSGSYSSGSSRSSGSYSPSSSSSGSSGGSRSSGSSGSSSSSGSSRGSGGGSWRR